MKYVFIAQNKKTWPVALMCKLLGVKKSGYYRWQTQQNDKDDVRDRLMQTILDIALESGYTYGSRRVRKRLEFYGYFFCRSKVRRLMKEAGVKVRYPKKYKVTTNSEHDNPIFENLLKRDFAAVRTGQAYVSDITYIWTQEGWLYLAVVIDLHHRKVVGWSMSSRMKADLVCDALKMAIWKERPKSDLIHHSDRGSQYASKKFRKLLNTYKIKGSMSRKGDCWDNAVAESFFASLKTERVNWRHYQTRLEAQQDILNYITMFYNNIRLHSYLGYCSPNEYEKKQVA